MVSVRASSPGLADGTRGSIVAGSLGDQNSDITVLASPALRGVLSDLGRDFERETGRRVEGQAYFRDGTAGAHFRSVVAELGLSSELSGVMRAYDAAGVDEAVRSGRTQYVVAGMGTLLAIPGIGSARALPEQFQRYTTYTVGISTRSAHLEAATAFLQVLRSPRARAVIARYGFQPLQR